MPGPTAQPQKSDQSSQAAKLQIFRSESKNAQDSLFGKEGHLFAKEGLFFIAGTLICLRERKFANQGHFFV